MRYLVVYERTPGGFSAYLPDLPGCVAAGDSFDETHDLIVGAIKLHIAGLDEDGLPIPEPSVIEFVDIAV